MTGGSDFKCFQYHHISYLQKNVLDRKPLNHSILIDSKKVNRISIKLTKYLASCISYGQKQEFTICSSVGYRDTCRHLQIQRNKQRSGSGNRQQGHGSDSSSTTVAQIFIPTELKESVTYEDKIAAFNSSMDNQTGIVVTPRE